MPRCSGKKICGILDIKDQLTGCDVKSPLHEIKMERNQNSRITLRKHIKVCLHLKHVQFAEERLEKKTLCCDLVFNKNER